MGLLTSKKSASQKCAICECQIAEKSAVDDLCERCFQQVVNVSAVLRYLQNTPIENLNTIQSASVQVTKSLINQSSQGDVAGMAHKTISSTDDKIQEQDERYYIVRKKTGERFLLSGSINKIGKSSEMSNISISDNNTLSRCHALIEKTSDGIYLSDFNSKNGTRHNGIRLEPGQKVVLNPGESFLLANELLTLIKE